MNNNNTSRALSSYVLVFMLVLMSQFQVVKADSGDVFATLLAYVDVFSRPHFFMSLCAKRELHDNNFI